MKRLIPILAMMILCLWPLLSMAEGEASGGLFPAEDENGKWGYVNEDGEFVIPAQFDHAFGFRGGYAEIVVFPEEYTGDRSPYFCGYSGLIDREGRIVLDPVWSIDAGYDEEFYGGLDSGIWIVMAGADDRDNDMEGWFDIGSG